MICFTIKPVHTTYSSSDFEVVHAKTASCCGARGGFRGCACIAGLNLHLHLQGRLSVEACFTTKTDNMTYVLPQSEACALIKKTPAYELMPLRATGKVPGTHSWMKSAPGDVLMSSPPLKPTRLPRAKVRPAAKRGPNPETQTSLCLCLRPFKVEAGKFDNNERFTYSQK